VIVWRFSQHEWLDGRGGLTASARWHTRGHEILYCASNPATALLEILVHSQVGEPAALSRHRFIKIEVPDEIARQEVEEAQLPPDWLRRIAVTRAWGDRWLREGQGALLLVPCVLVPETYDVLINPRYVDASKIQRLSVFPYPLDSRHITRP
jgi:RES domain-containing protein